MSASAILQDYHWCIIVTLTGMYLIAFNESFAKRAARRRQKYFGTVWGERDIRLFRVMAVVVGIGSISWAISCVRTH